MPPIAARSEREAFREYVAPVQRAIAAFAENAFLLRVPSEPGLDAGQLRFPGRGFVILRGADREARVTLAARLYYRLVQAVGAPRRWTVQTVGYLYRLDSVTEQRPLVAYHWHPHVEGIAFPHVHVASTDRPEQERLHVATPHSTLLHVLAFAVRDCRVCPIQGGWRRALGDPLPAVALTGPEGDPGARRHDTVRLREAVGDFRAGHAGEVFMNVDAMSPRIAAGLRYDR